MLPLQRVLAFLLFQHFATFGGMEFLEKRIVVSAECQRCWQAPLSQDLLAKNNTNKWQVLRGAGENRILEEDAGWLAGRQKVVFHLRHLPLPAHQQRKRKRNAIVTGSPLPYISSNPPAPFPLLATISGRFWPLLLSLEQNISADMNFALALCVFSPFFFSPSRFIFH